MNVGADVVRYRDCTLSGPRHGHNRIACQTSSKTHASRIRRSNYVLAVDQLRPLEAHLFFCFLIALWKIYRFTCLEQSRSVEYLKSDSGRTERNARALAPNFRVIAKWTDQTPEGMTPHVSVKTASPLTAV